MLKDTDYDLLSDLWTVKDREDLFLDCVAYCEDNYNQKPLVILVIDFLQIALCMNGMSSRNLEDMYQDHLETERCKNGI